MKMVYRNALMCVVTFFAMSQFLGAQTASSLFWKSDGKQVGEIVSESGDEYKKVGHHGPAVENSHFALRIYFNDSGAVDVYSKSGRGMELMAYKWYPTAEQQETLGAGCDEYVVGKTLGLGGVALWDGSGLVRLKATKGRTARAGETKNGSFAEMVSYGVPYDGGTVDILVRIETVNKSREALVTVRELSKKKVRFVTGVNYHPGETVKCTSGSLFVWGTHPVQVSTAPVPVGAGLFFSPSAFGPVEMTSDMLRIVSVPTSQISYRVVAASTKEAELNNAKRFEAYMTK